MFFEISHLRVINFELLQQFGERNAVDLFDDVAGFQSGAFGGRIFVEPRDDEPVVNQPQINADAESGRVIVRVFFFVVRTVRSLWTGGFLVGFPRRFLTRFRLDLRFFDCLINFRRNNSEMRPTEPTDHLLQNIVKLPVVRRLQNARLVFLFYRIPIQTAERLVEIIVFNRLPDGIKSGNSPLKLRRGRRGDRSD